MATDRDVIRKLKVTSGSKYFWVYALSLWDPDALWKCVSGASGFALIGLVLTAATSKGPSPLMATTIFEYSLLGLILMWLYNLGAWLQPTNLMVIFTFIFRLYRRNKTVEDLSAEEIGRLFPNEFSDAPERGKLTEFFLWARRSPVIGPLLLGCSFAVLIVGLLVVSS